MKGITNGAVCHPKKEVQGDLFATPELFSASAPSGGFSEVVMDPPWVTKSRGARYAQEADLRRLFRLPLPAVLSADAVVAVWVTNDPRKQAFVRDELLPRFGCAAAATWTWIKVPRSVGWGRRFCCDLQRLQILLHEVAGMICGSCP